MHDSLGSPGALSAASSESAIVGGGSEGGNGVQDSAAMRAMLAQKKAHLIDR